MKTRANRAAKQSMIRQTAGQPCIRCHAWKRFWCLLACPEVSDILDDLERTKWI